MATCHAGNSWENHDFMSQEMVSQEALGGFIGEGEGGLTPSLNLPLIKSFL